MNLKKWLPLLALYVVVHSSFASILSDNEKLVYESWSVSNGTDTWDCKSETGCADWAEALNMGHEQIEGEKKYNELNNVLKAQKLLGEMKEITK